MAETKKRKKTEYSMTLPIGTILKGGKNAYRIEEVLGQGNYGITYKASATITLGNISKLWYFAIKENFAKDYCSREADGIAMTYPQNRAEKAERDLKEFVAEGKTLSEICNGNKYIINVNETFEANNTAYYAMEFIDGGDLRTLVENKGQLSEAEAVNLITPIIDAVAHLHRNHRLHLDIKPENIVLKKDGTPILIDFGLTLHFKTDGSRTGTSKDKSAGFSEGYAPMEQYLGIISFAPEVDVYALGATLYFMLVGKDPEKASNINSKKIEANLPSGISQQIRSAIFHAMSALAENRTQTAELFRNEIEKEVAPPLLPTSGIQIPLPNNYMLHIGKEDYHLENCLEKGPFYLKYSVIRERLDYRGNKQKYYVYEFYDTAFQSRTKYNRLVSDVKPTELKTYHAFLKLVEEVTGHSPRGLEKVTGYENKVGQVYKANNTLYFISIVDSENIHYNNPTEDKETKQKTDFFSQVFLYLSSKLGEKPGFVIFLITLVITLLAFSLITMIMLVLLLHKLGIPDIPARWSAPLFFIGVISLFFYTFNFICKKIK